MDCYRLAKYYSVDPAVFLGKSLSEVQRHVHWTAKLIELTSPPEGDNG